MTTNKRRSLLARTLAVVCAAATVVAPRPAAATVERPTSHSIADAVLTAMQRDLQLTRPEAIQRVSLEAKAAAVQVELVPKLGGAYAGSWFDAAGGNLVVAVNSRGAMTAVKEAGAVAALVPHSMASLQRLKQRIDAVGAADAHGVLSSWGVDTAGNAVVVDVVGSTVPAALRSLVSSHRTMLQIRSGSKRARGSSQYLDAGETIVHPNAQKCSAGFNATRDRGNGAIDAIVLGAAHCGNQNGNRISGFDGQFLGYMNQNQPWTDWAITELRNQYWIPGPWVSLHTPADDVLTVRGHQQLPERSTVCKSGQTSKVTCGIILGRGQTVRWSDGHVIRGLTKTDACQEAGDSGGPYYSPAGQAQGIASTALMLTSGQCVSKDRTRPAPNQSWYVEANYYVSMGARLTTG